MGTDIHMITQVKKDGGWEYVKELPDSLNERNYTTFAFLAGIRENFPSNGFQCKGLPVDLGGTKFGFVSYRESAEKRYGTETEKRVRLEDGSYISTTDESMLLTGLTEEEAKAYPVYGRYLSPFVSKYHAYDPKKVNGELVEVPVRELMSFEEFLEDYYDDEWDYDMQDYGKWSVDFSCEDFHSHSHLTLEELQKKDLSTYMSCKAKIPKLFYDSFLRLGGIMPEKIKVLETSEDDSLIPQALLTKLGFPGTQEVYVMWEDDSIKKEATPVGKGIHELEEIARKYGVDSDSIRIVFAFDN